MESTFDFGIPFRLLMDIATTDPILESDFTNALIVLCSACLGEIKLRPTSLLFYMLFLFPFYFCLLDLSGMILATLPAGF
jgi:hypothetical protein